jgi:hypothetical protein
MNRAWLIPLPPAAVATAAKGETKRAVGLYPCINDNQCDQFILVKLDNKGHPYGTCSPHDINIKGCRVRSIKGAPDDVPEQTHAAYLDALETVQSLTDIPGSYLKYLEHAWATYEPEEAADENISA